MRDLTGRTDPAEQAGRRQNIAVAAMAVTAIVAIVTVVVGPWRGGGEMSGIEGQAGPKLVTAPPPEVDTGGPHLIVSPASVPAGGGDVALIMVNPGEQELGYGPLGRLQGWDGSAWTDRRQVTTGLGPEQPAGGLRGLDEELMVPMIAFGAGPGGFGRPLWTHVQGLDPGWYRFSFSNASGLLRVGGPAGPSPFRPATAFAFDSGGVVPVGTETELHLTVVPRQRLRGSFDASQQVGSYTGDAAVERLDGERWIPLAPGTETRTEDGNGVAAPFTLHLPALETGVYRIGRETSVAGRIESLFWVAPLE